MIRKRKMSEIADSTTGLTNGEKDIIRNTWAEVKKDIKGNGYDLFIRFFTENPTYQQHFKGFSDVPIAELRGNKKVLAHANSVLYAITSLVDNLDDPECLVEMLKKVSESHVARGIAIPMFINLGTTIVGLLIDKLGPNVMDTVAIEAWKKTYGVIVHVIKQNYEAGDENSVQ